MISGGKSMIHLHTNRYRIRWFFALALLPALFLVGCDPTTTRVSGKVTYRGTPLPEGTVMFFCEDGTVVRSSPIAEDGTYAVDKVPVGPAKIAVTTPPPRPPMPRGLESMAPGGKEVKQPIPIPPEYGDPGKSGLAWDVEDNNPTHDIALP
jgi:hypothetical protein